MQLTAINTLVYKPPGSLATKFFDSESTTINIDKFKDLFYKILDSEKFNQQVNSLVNTILREFNSSAGLFYKVLKTNQSDLAYETQGLNQCKLPRVKDKKKTIITNPNKEVKETVHMQNNLNLDNINKVNISAFYKKNAVVSDYHVEELGATITAEIEIREQFQKNPEYLTLQQLMLNAIAEKATIQGMYFDGLFDKETLDKKMESVQKKLDHVSTQMQTLA